MSLSPRLSVLDRKMCSEKSCELLAMTVSNVTWSLYVKIPTYSSPPAPIASPQTHDGIRNGQFHLVCAAISSEPTSLVF